MAVAGLLLWSKGVVDEDEDVLDEDKGDVVDEDEDDKTVTILKHSHWMFQIQFFFLLFFFYLA